MIPVYSPTSYAANIGTTVFAIPWAYQSTSHVKPYLDGVLLTTGFTVSAAGPSGTVTFGVAPFGTTITFIRELPLDQPVDFQNQGSFSSKRHEDEYDRLVMQVAQVSEKADRAVIAKVGSSGVVLPSPESNKVLGWSGNDLVNVQSIPTGSVSGAMVPVVTAPTLDQARTAFGGIVAVVDTIAHMKALTAPIGAQTYLVRGYYAAGDGGGGTFRWNSADATTDNGGTVIQLNAGGVGRFNRIWDGSVKARWFGAKGDGSNDDSSAINAALSFIGDGGQVELGTGNYFCSSSINVLAGRALIGATFGQGTSGNPGNSNQTQAARPINIISSAAVAINVYAGGSLVNVSVIKSGVTFNQSNVANFANTGVVINGDDVYIFNGAVYGFNQGISSSGFQRTKIIGVIGDCVNGIWINQAYDIATVERCHFWPYVTIASGEPNSTRNGIAFYFSEVADWCRLDKCFAYGYLTSFRLKAVAQMRVSNCGADASASLVGTRTGFKIETGTANTSEIVLSDCIASYQTYGVDSTMPSGEYLSIKGMSIFNVGASCFGIRCNSGSVIVSNGTIAGSGSTAIGISLPTETYGSIVSDVAFRLAGGSSTCVKNNHNEHIHQLFGLTQYGSSQLYDCASALEAQLLSPSASNLTLPAFNRNTGTYVINNSISAAFSNIVSNNKMPGQIITLIFNSAITITNSATLTVKGSSVVTAAENVMQFVYKGSGYWIEVSRNF